MGLLIPIEVRSMSFSFLLEERILKASLRFETFTITLFGPFSLLTQWQSSTLEGSTLTSNFPKTFKTVFSRVLLPFASGMPVNSRHSRLEYWLLLQHWGSKLVTISLNTELTCLATERSEPSYSKSCFKSDSSFLILANVELNLLWQSRAKLIISSLDNFFKSVSDSAMIKQISVTYYSYVSSHTRSTSARFGDQSPKEFNFLIITFSVTLF